MHPAEFTQRIAPMQNKLFRFALRFVADAAEAEDIVQEALIKVWNRRNELDQYRNLEAWCMTVTKNLALDKLKIKTPQSTGIIIGATCRNSGTYAGHNNRNKRYDTKIA